MLLPLRTPLIGGLADSGGQAGLEIASVAKYILHHDRGAE